MEMESVIETMITSISDLVEEPDPIQNINCISEMPYPYFKKFVSLATGQTDIQETGAYLLYSIYKVDQKDRIPKKVIDLDDNSSVADGHMCLFTLQCRDNILNLHAVHPSSMATYMLRYAQRYSFFPLLMNREVSEEEYKKDPINCAGHQLCLIIDSHEKDFFLFDPNGRYVYFDKEIDTSELVTMVMQKYVDDIAYETGKMLGHSLRGAFTFRNEFYWNPTQKVLNQHFSDARVVQGGNCLPLTLIFIHYLNLSQESIVDVYKYLVSLESSVLTTIIYLYSCNIINLLGLHKIKELNDP